MGGLLRLLGLSLAALYLFLLAAWAFKLAFTRPLPAALELPPWLFERWGAAALYGVAAFTFLLGVYFLSKLWELGSRQRRFVRDGAQGPIEVSPAAIQDYIGGLLQRETGLSRSQVGLDHAAGGAIDITLTIVLTADSAVVHTAERLQRTLKEHVEARLGIEVNRVTVYTQRIQPGEAQAAPLPRLRGDGPPAAGRSEAQEEENDAP